MGVGLQRGGGIFRLFLLGGALSLFCVFIWACIFDHGSSGCVVLHANVFQRVYNEARGCCWVKLVAMLNGAGCVSF